MSQKRPGMGRVPTWLVVAVVVACLSGSVAGMWWWLKRDIKGVEEMVVDAPQRGGRMRLQGRPAEGVMKGTDSVLMARAGGLQVRFKAEGNDFKVVPIAAGGGIAPEQEALRRSVRRVVQNPALAKRIQLTDEQRQKLKQLNLKSGLDIAEQDRARLESLAKACQQAAAGDARRAAEKALLDAMKEIGSKGGVPTLEGMMQSVKQIQAILTPQQIQVCQEMEGKPATRPAGGPRGGMAKSEVRSPNQ